MPKRLLCTLLVGLLLTATVSCRRGGDSVNPDSGDSFPPADTVTEAVTNPTDGTVAPPQDAPTPDEAPKDRRFDSLLLNGSPCLEGDVFSSLKATDYTVTIPDPTAQTSLELGGWVGFPMAVDAFGYSLDGGDTVYGNFSAYTEEAVKEEGGAYAQRFCITVPLMTLKPGTHTVMFFAKLIDGTEKPLLEPITLFSGELTVDASRRYHSSISHINGKGENGGLSYSGRGGNSDRGLDILDATLDGHSVSKNRRITLSGWMAVDGGVEGYVWSPDGFTWYPAVTSGHAGEPSEGYFASLGYENASDNALFFNLALDLTPRHGRNISVTVGAIPKDSPDTVVPFITVTGLHVPLLPTDIDFAYTSQIENDEVGDDLTSSDLAYAFDFRYGAGSVHHALESDGVKFYAYEGINDFSTTVTGRFAMTARIRQMTGCSFLFVRGTRSVLSVVEAPLRPDNFFEQDGAGLCGGAGIYAKLSEGVLTVVIKAFDENSDYRIRNCSYTYAVSGDELTLADDGSTVYVLVDGREITRIELDGVVEYPGHFVRISPAIKFCATATITLESGKTEIIHNTLVASDYNAQCGAAVRGGIIHFEEISLLPYSDVFPDAP